MPDPSPNQSIPNPPQFKVETISSFQARPKYTLIASVLIIIGLSGSVLFAFLQNIGYNNFFKQECDNYYVITGPGMMPTYDDKEKVCVKEVVERTELKRGDVAIVIPSEKEILIKRIVGLPGETVVFENGQISVQTTTGGQQKLDEPYLRLGIETYKQPNQKSSSKVSENLLAAEEYYILDDNRPESTKDSRQTGPVQRNQIKYIAVKKIK